MGRAKTANPREVLIQTRVPEDVAGWVAEMAYETGDTASGWVRRIVMRDYRQANVLAMVRHKGESNPLLLLAHFSPTHSLAATNHITALDREFLLLDSQGQALTRSEVTGQDWFRRPSEYRFILEGSPNPWKIVTLIGFASTLHADLEWSPPDAANAVDATHPARASRRSR